MLNRPAPVAGLHFLPPCRALKTDITRPISVAMAPHHVEQWRERIFMNPIYRIESELPMSQRYDLPQLLDIMARLRDPNGGCPWDLKQSFQTIVPHTLEEAYEVADAIESEDWQGLKGSSVICCSRSCSMPSSARSRDCSTLPTSSIP